MVIDVVKELAVAKAKVIELQSTLEKELKQKLAKLPAEFGFDNLPDFIAALKAAAGARKGRAGASKSASSGKKRGKRANITPELRDKVKAAVHAGKTGGAIAKEFGISLPSVQNIKKAFGLVKSRK